MTKNDTLTHNWLMERRYFSLIIASAFIILSISAFFICYRHHVVNTKQALKEDRSAANLLSLLLDEHLKKIVSVMESYGNRPLLLRAVKDKNALKAKVHLISLTKSNRDVDSVIITDRRGTLWAAYPERPEVLGKNFAHRDWYKDVSKKWKSNISDVYLRVIAEKDLAVAVYVPLFDETGEVIGIMMDTQRTFGLSPLFKQMPIEPGQDITVIDRKGQIVYSSQHDVEKEIRPYPFHPDMKKAIAAKNKTFDVDDPDLGGRTRYITFAPVVSIGWTVIVGRDKRSILMSGSAYYVQVTAIAFFLFLSVIILLFYSRKQVMTQQIQEQLQAEKTIRAGAERYKSYIDVTMQVGWTTNDRGEIVEDNPSFSKYTGRGYEEIKGFGWIEDIHPDDRDHTGQIWRKAVAEKSFYETEYRLRRYDGVYRNFLARGMPLLAENGSVQEWVGSCIDITDRKQADEALKKSEENFRNLFDNALEGIYQSTPEGRLISVNMAFSRMVGYKSPEEFINTVTDLGRQLYVNPDDRERAVGIFRETGYIENFECQMRRKDGSIFWARYDGRLTKTPDGTPCFQGFILDITEHKQMEEEIRATLYGIGDGVIATDTSGHVKRMNPVAETLTGWSESEALDKPLLHVFRIINEETRQPVDNPVSRVIREGLVVGLANHSLLIASDGKERPIADSGAPIRNASGVITGAVLVFRDQTAERTAAVALRKSEEKYRGIFENAIEGIFQTSPTGQYISVNPAYVRMLGYESAEELMGSITDIPKQVYVDQNERAELLRLLTKHGSVSGFEIQLYRKDRSIINLAVGARVVKNDKGNFIRLEGVVEDITERKRAQEELDASQRLLSSMIDAITESAFLMTPDGTILLANEAVAQRLGATPGTMAGKSVYDLIPLELAQTRRLQIEEVVRSRAAVYFEDTRLGRHILNSVYPVLDLKGDVGQLAVFGYDITERKRAEEALRKSEAQLLAMLNATPFPIALVDVQDNKIDFWSHSALTLFGHTAPTAAEWYQIAYPDPDYQREVLDRWKPFLEIARESHQTVNTGEYRVTCSDGSARICELYVTFLTDRLLITFNDITERKRAEETLRQSEARYRTLVENIPQKIFMKNRDYRFMSINENFARDLGFRPEEVVGKMDTDLFTPELADKYRADDVRIMETGQTEELEERYFQEDKETWVNTIKTPVRDANGEIVGLLGIFWDITERKRAQKALEKTTADLERSNKELEQFAYVASHDLQEPLRMVSSYTQLLEQRYKDKLDQDAKDFIGFAVDGANRMQGLIQDLLEYSRVTTRGQSLAPLDSHEALGEAVKNLKVTIQETGALVTNNDLPIVLGDHTQIVQVFQNLIGNGIKFKRSGVAPRIHISAENDSLDSRFRVFKVSDNGIGIEPRHFVRLFEIFQRLHSKQEYPGTGIGLALCKRIVERHGGRIWVESEPGKGSSFLFTLPGEGHNNKNKGEKQ